MILAFLVFLLVTGAIMGAYHAAVRLPGMLASRRMDQRLKEVSFGGGAGDPNPGDETILKTAAAGPLPGVDRLIAATGAAGAGLARLIEQSGVRTTPGAIVLMSLMAAAFVGLVLRMLVSSPFAAPLGAAFFGAAPTLFLLHRRGARRKRFEEQFPEALDLMSRAIRAGHALQTALGMAAEELPDPVGPEFKKTFDQQNFGLPLRDCLNEMAARIPIMDVRFFVTAVLIQRETGGNLAEILDNLAHVVRERFKIRRQIRVHTAHGRFTGYVLLALPAALGVALSFINPEHMNLLFRERMGQMMLMGAIVMQTIGYFWIRQVIKIEV
jgi:tight adherence protein B